MDSQEAFYHAAEECKRNGYLRGVAEGKTEGFNHALDVVKNLMRGIPPKQIAEEHGRSVEEIERIQREILSV